MRYIPLFLLTSLSLVFMTPVLATNIACPSVELVRQSAENLDTVWLINKKEYNIYNQEETLYTGDHDWTTVVWAPGNQDFNTAFNGAQEKVKSIAKLHDEFADENEVLYICGYLDSNDQPAAALVTSKFSDTDIKKAIKQKLSKFTIK